MGGVQQHYVIIDIIYVHMYIVLKVADLWLSGADIKGIFNLTHQLSNFSKN